jgi:hypothetical protein
MKLLKLSTPLLISSNTAIVAKLNHNNTGNGIFHFPIDIFFKKYFIDLF